MENVGFHCFLWPAIFQMTYLSYTCWKGSLFICSSFKNKNHTWTLSKIISKKYSFLCALNVWGHWVVLSYILLERRHFMPSLIAASILQQVFCKMFHFNQITMLRVTLKHEAESPLGSKSLLFLGESSLVWRIRLYLRKQEKKKSQTSTFSPMFFYLIWILGKV